MESIRNQEDFFFLTLFFKIELQPKPSAQDRVTAPAVRASCVTGLPCINACLKRGDVKKLLCRGK